MASSLQRRRMYRYPSDNDDSAPEVLDEEEQENLIQKLVQENDTKNLTFTRALLALPIIAIVPYVKTIFDARTALLSLLSITSLLVTAYLLVTLPPHQTGFASFDDRSRLNALPQHVSAQFLSSKGPLLQYLPYLNLALCVTQAILGAAARHRIPSLWFGFSWLPPVIYVATVLAKWAMGTVDPAKDLNKLRYEFKGA